LKININGSSVALIVGAGTAGRSLAEDLEQRGINIVGYLDDNVSGPHVLGRLDDVPEVIKAEKVDCVFFAIPSVTSDVLRNFIGKLNLREIEFAVVPRTYNILAKDKIDINDLSDIDVLDLVGRAPVKHDMVAAQKLIAGKKVLVSGAAGSIGSRLVEQVLSLNPSSIVCIDRHENGMFRLVQKLQGNPRFSSYIADVQNEKLIGKIMAEVKPDFVFHAAAYKHVPLMEENPIEAVNNNIWGTYNLMNQAGIAGVASFVYVSTDKAVNSANVMGATKRAGELLLADFGKKYPSTRFAGVRFGNVLQSEGSVMQIFRDQIAKRQPLTITHPDITRYFMTIDEASQLIIQAASLSDNAELFVLDMGEPIRVIDLAKGLINAVNPSLDIQIIGLRPGEKMFEELSYDENEKDSTTHPKIFVLKGELGSASDKNLAWAEKLTLQTRNYELNPHEVVAQLSNRGLLVRN
jgi:FlaA1/EpsC-like NDP-sugar epimerase